jgi:hypothetical protein
MLTGFHIPTIVMGMAGILPLTHMVSVESVDPGNWMGLGGAGMGLGDVFLSVPTTVGGLSLPVDQFLGLVHRLRDFGASFGTLFTSTPELAVLVH